MSALGSGTVALLLVILPAQGRLLSETWTGAEPIGQEESDLRRVLGSADSQMVRAAALQRLASAHAGTAVSGLALLASGILLLDSGSAAQAIPPLRHPDIYRSSLGDLGLLTLGRALEGTADFVQASQTYLALATTFPRSPFVCGALYRGADALVRADQADGAIPLLGRVVRECPEEKAAALLRLAQVHESRRDLLAAAVAYDQLDAEHPATPQATEAARRLKVLRSYLPTLPPASRVERELRKADILAEAGHVAEAARTLKSLAARSLPGEHAEAVGLRLGRVLLTMGRAQEAARQFSLIPRGSAAEAEAAFLLAQMRAKRERRPDAYEAVVAAFPKTSWAEDALLNLAASHHKQARLELAVSDYRHLRDAFPEGRYFDRATWWTAWWDYRNGRFREAADALESAARLRPGNAATAGFLYWAARARERLGEKDRTRDLLLETVKGFKHSYHGLRAATALGLPTAAATAPSESVLDIRSRIPEPHGTRIRELLLIDRPEEALQEIRLLPDSADAQATAAFIHRRQGRLRKAINTMKKAYPEWRSQAGDQLPDWVWRVLYPLEFAPQLVASARDESLDPALLAALIWQESTFDPRAISPAGARGLMQVIPRTGRRVARSLGIRYRQHDLYDPDVSLGLGTRYLRQMLDQFGGRLERALAAYNAGPGRVQSWAATWPDLDSEEFIESIPLTETRNYVMNVLAHQEHYRRLYGLTPAPVAGLEASLP